MDFYLLNEPMTNSTLDFNPTQTLGEDKSNRTGCWSVKMKAKKICSPTSKVCTEPVQLKYPTTRPNDLKKASHPHDSSRLEARWQQCGVWSPGERHWPLLLHWSLKGLHMFMAHACGMTMDSPLKKPAGSRGVSNIALWRQLLTKLTAATFILVKQRGHLVGS